MLFRSSYGEDTMGNFGEVIGKILWGNFVEVSEEILGSMGVRSSTGVREARRASEHPSMHKFTWEKTDSKN